MTRTLWRFAVLFVVALALATVAVLGVRGQTSRVPPREFAKGMVDQPKAKAQAKTLARLMRPAGLCVASRKKQFMCCIDLPAGSQQHLANAFPATCRKCCSSDVSQRIPN